MRIHLILLTSVLLSACNLIPPGSGAVDPILSAPAAVETAPLDDLSAAPQGDRAAAFSRSASTVAGLGDPTVPGLWMETPLVTVEQRALVRSATGAEVALTLRPIAGEASAGSRLSIEAMRSLGAPLTELVALMVSAAP
ncbi:hypothetical protein [Parasedimentitalea psychrophila]|uniref:D-galactarate dehydratase n=1 Tax=Parasedimentitalea psychrophila TaxID=2997337 RepID=A0A9Y2P1C2_9RHOB|nr:hypothetical protein [Parasedimentitalea psychrophila]WIY25456.1 hypothetical protein QPJ95_00425 [Parasedimentitalea psychrophila]